MKYEMNECEHVIVVDVRCTIKRPTTMCLAKKKKSIVWVCLCVTVYVCTCEHCQSVSVHEVGNGVMVVEDAHDMFAAHQTSPGGMHSCICVGTPKWFFDSAVQFYNLYSRIDLFNTSPVT